MLTLLFVRSGIVDRRDFMSSLKSSLRSVCTSNPVFGLYVLSGSSCQSGHCSQKSAVVISLMKFWDEAILNNLNLKFNWVNYITRQLFYLYRIRRCPAPLSSPSVSLGKSWSLAVSMKKIYIENFLIRNYFKKDLLNFSFH